MFIYISLSVLYVQLVAVVVVFFEQKNIKACADDVLSIGENVFCYDFAKTFVSCAQLKHSPLKWVACGKKMLYGLFIGLIPITV